MADPQGKPAFDPTAAYAAGAGKPAFDPTAAYGPARPNHAVNAASETVGDTSHLSDTDVVNNFAQSHPIAGGAARLVTAGANAVANTIAGAPGAIKHAVTDESTPEESSLSGPQRIAYRLLGGHEIAQAASDWVDAAKGSGPGAQLLTKQNVKSVLPEAVGTGIGSVAGGAALGKIGGAAKAGVAKLTPVAEAISEAPKSFSSLEKLTKTTPEDIAGLNETTAKAERVRQTVTAAESQAHRQASAAFPEVPGEITVKETPGTTREVDTGIKDAQGQPIMRTETTPPTKETVMFRDLQQERSELLQRIAREERAVNEGAAPRYDVADLQKQRANIDVLMDKMATDAGVKPQLDTARGLYKKYMDDFHNPGSPLRGILDAEPGETAKISNHLLNKDNGARAIETLRERGVPTQDIDSLLSKGSGPLKESVTEAAKLRKAGSPEAYKTQRYREALDQTVTNKLQAGTEAKLPAAAMKSKIFGQTTVTPRNLTQIRLRSALAKGLKTP